MIQEDSEVNKRLEDAIEKYADTVKRISFMYVKNYTDADDIMQEVFIKYMLQNKKFQSDSHEKSWIILVTVNKCKDFIKSYWKRNVSSIGERDFTAPEDDDGGDVLEYVKKLPEKYSILIYLFYYENYTVPEISNMLNLNTNTIYTGLYRARALLKNYMGSDQNE